jgi:HEAT repeat protein
LDSEGYPRAEEVLRLLSAAAYAARLYPPASALPAQAAADFTQTANVAAASAGPMRYIVEPHGFRMGDVALAAGQSQVLALAESLYALQVGQLIVAPGVTQPETTAFVTIAIADPAAVRQRGGMRAVLVQTGVSHLAVIELTLRQTEEEGLLGLDLLTAPLDDIASEAAKAAGTWAETASAGQGTDDVASAIGRLEQATREIAAERIAQALMRLDEQTRMRVLGWSLHADLQGQRMQGMLDVVAKMKPAALARLLKLVAVQAGTEPGRIAGALELPPETLSVLALLLAPTPSADPDFGAAPEVLASSIAEELAQPFDYSDIDRQISIASPELAAGRSLTTAVAVSRTHPDIDAIKAIAAALPQAATDGVFRVVREALRRLDELATAPALLREVQVARAALADPSVLAGVCAAPQTDADAAIAGEILHSAGPLGAEALLTYYVRAPEAKKSLLRPVLRNLSEPVLGVAGKMLRSEDAAVSSAILRALPILGDKRTVPVIAAALDNLDVQVRRSAVTALAETPGPEAGAALARAVNHWDPATQRWAIREIGRAKAVGALPQLVRALDDINVQRTHDTKKEIIGALAQIGSPEGLPALKRAAGRKLVFGKKNKELRFIAQRAVAHLQQAQETAAEQATESARDLPRRNAGER